MIVIPAYVLALIPPLTVWWAHRRCERREYVFLVLTFLAVFIPLLILAANRHLTATWYAGPLAATGIMTIQIPMALLVTTLLAAIPLKMKVVRDVVALLAGEITLFVIGGRWIS